MEEAITLCPICQTQATDLMFERADKYHQERHWWKCDSCSHMRAVITGPVLEIRDTAWAFLQAYAGLTFPQMLIDR